MARTPLAYLFKKALLKVPEPAVDDIGLRHESPGLGFPGEKLDLVCPQCGAEMRLRQSKNFKKSPLFYGCSAWPACNATHGAKRDGSPVGLPGDQATRKARMYAHRVFDRLWDAKPGEMPIMSRYAAYAWLRKEMKLSEKDAHIGFFDTERCLQLEALVKKKFPGTKNAWDMIVGDDEPY